MKGIIFTEFIEFAESTYGLDVVDQLVSQNENQGVYTAIGTYPPAELVAMFGKLSEISDTAIPDLLIAFGKWLFAALATAYPQYVDQANNAFDMLSQIHDHIHVEVLKLYPDAELPEFEHKFTDDNTMLLTYKSVRGLGDLAYGLILACIERYGERMEVSQQDLSGGHRTTVQFKIQRLAGD